MAKSPQDKPEKAKSDDTKGQNSNALIASKLRGYYDTIIEEGTPSHLIDLLERLHEAETKAKK
ncbi:NepR family anti-sigma factor [Rhizobium sp. CECT 9324]|jgi:hypothetical protein|uniref:NepR family anti-sigma factor n=1 Tax=Rhizobium sp. CECT 9324 TaxID=2845820 RepID=UPI000DDD2704|nr:NepR family anti-sigma factor [Rhizobium sp. CECT 9324]CAH0341941.1 hypothetical protein RHI9324_03649 [Rhizobium sp. CECT 9324]